MEPKKILVVDDDTALRTVLTGLLERDFRECEMLEAVDGIDGMDKFKEACPDLVITDLQMPVSDGFELTKNIRMEGGKEIKIIAVSGYEDFKELALELGANDFLKKPYTGEEIIGKIKNL